MMKSGDCVIKHVGVYTTGMQMVVSDLTFLSHISRPISYPRRIPDNYLSPLNSIFGLVLCLLSAGISSCLHLR